WPGSGDKPATPTTMKVKPPVVRAPPPPAAPASPPAARPPAAAASTRPTAADPLPGSLAASATPFVGNSRNKKVHKADCKWAQQMSDANRVPLRTLEDAMKEGYTNCKECFK